MFRAVLENGILTLAKVGAALAVASRLDLGSEHPFESVEAQCAGGMMRRLQEIGKKEKIYIAPEKEYDDAPPTEPDAFHEAGSTLPYSQNVWDYHHTAGAHVNVRADEIERLKTEEFDLLIIGGGITGAGAALEAATRGAKVALIDKGDFASCTSSKSTKLIHGGVRYLEQAFTQLDWGMIDLVKEALHERAHMLRAANYMNHPAPILIPINTWWEIPYMYVGVKLYEWYARGHRVVPKATVLSAAEAKEQFPSLRGDDLKGAIVYYDGQMNDARYTLTVALTAKEHGATVANYVKVDALTHMGGADSEQYLTKRRVTGAVVTDVLTGESFPIRAAAVLNATGPYSDVIRKMDDPAAVPLVVHSAGVHVSLPSQVCPPDMGMLIPKTKDGRLLFCLPWEGGVVAGTTDAAAELSDDPAASDADVDFILGALNDVLDTPLTRNDVLSVWAGLRPLVRDPKATSTSKLSRQHVILASESRLVSVMGGKFTTYRHMGEEAVDMLRSVSPRMSTVCKPESATRDMLLQGAFQERRKYERLRTVLLSGFGMSDESAAYLIQNYGARARVIAAMAARQAQEEHAAATAPSARYALTRALGRVFSYGTAKAALPYLNPVAWVTWAYEFTRGREAWEIKRDKKRATRDELLAREERRDTLSREERARIRQEKTEDRRAGIYTIAPIAYNKPAPRGSRVFEGSAEVGHDALRWRDRVRCLSSEHPALEAEVVYAVKYEMAQTVTDVLARRIRMGFTNAGAAGDAIERTAELMGPRLGWSTERTQREVDGARAYFAAMDYRKMAPPVTAD